MMDTEYEAYKTVQFFGIERCESCGVKVWQDQDGNIRCNHKKDCPYNLQRSSGKNRHKKMR